MNPAYQKKLERAKAKTKFFKKLLAKIGDLPGKTADQLFHEAHESEFECVDCLKCANCCSTTGPLFTPKDVERIAAFLGMKPGEFTARFLRVDEDCDYVLQKVPCAFLMDDNRCTIYEVRPKACREYPHTDMQNMKSKLKITLKNSVICPAVAGILDRIEACTKNA